MNDMAVDKTKVCRVVVHQARNLLAKGGDGSYSSPFVKISCDKERFSTSVAEKLPNPRWNEDCEFTIANNSSSVDLLVCHRGKLLDDFLGMVTVPIERSRIATKKWYKLQHRPSKTKSSKDRGEIEVSIEVVEIKQPLYSDRDDGEGSEVKGHSGSSKGKRPSHLRAKAPGLNKIRIPHRKSHTTSNEDDSGLTEYVTRRKKSDSNDSGQASDSPATESPPSLRQLSHNAQGNFGSQESISSVGSNSKTGSLKRRMKSALGGLKKDKAHTTDSNHSPYNSMSSLPPPTPDVADPPIPCDNNQLAALNPPPSPPSVRRQLGTNWIHTASTSELYTSASRAARSLTYPLRAISEEHIPLAALYPQSWEQESGRGQHCREGGRTESKMEHREEGSSRDVKLRHSFRSGLPSLRNSNISVTFDPSTESGYGTVMKEPEPEGQLPVQYEKMTKESLIRRLLLKERILKERQQYIRQLEDYTDNLLLKVMLESPRLLDRDFHPQIVRPTR